MNKYIVLFHAVKTISSVLNYKKKPMFTFYEFSRSSKRDLSGVIFY